VTRRLRVGVITPSPRGSRSGNRITALRWSQRLRELGHAPFVQQHWNGRDCDLLVALHARKSAASVLAFGARHPDRPMALLLAGTDVYPEFRPDAATLAALQAAARIVALQPQARAVLPPGLRDRVRVIVQSAPECAPRPKVAGAFQAAVVAHLRPVKDPLLPAQAARALPPDSRVQVVLIGGALDPGLAAAAAAEARANPRFAWLGELPRRSTLERIAESRCLLLPSRGEGGANVLSEAIAAGLPVLATAIPGSTGILGADHPGLFPVGDAEALTALLHRTETDATFRAALEQRSRALQPLVRPAREREDWRALLQELFP
jgi:putative glycosyltransferase (TIGR04348 family)